MTRRALTSLKGWGVPSRQSRAKGHYLFPHHPFEAKEIQVHSFHTRHGMFRDTLWDSQCLCVLQDQDKKINQITNMSLSWWLKETKALGDPGKVFLGAALLYLVFTHEHSSQNVPYTKKCTRSVLQMYILGLLKQRLQD